LAALRHLFDCLVTGHVIEANPAHAVRGPSHAVRSGKTPVLDPKEARALLDSIDVTTEIGLRDRALMNVLLPAGVCHRGRSCVRPKPARLLWH
jgi:integrase/recombinase XerC